MLALGLAACGSSSDDDDDQAMVCPAGQIGTYPDCSDPPPTAYETATAAIAAATTAAEAQAAVDAAVAAGITGAQLQSLNMAVAARTTALAMMGRATEQRAGLMMAADAIDTSDLSDAEAIAAANSAIAALKAAIAAAADVDDTSMYDAQVTAAETAVAAAQLVLDRAAQMMALTDAIGGLQAIDLAGLSTQAAIDAAQAGIAALQAALDGATDLTATEKTAANIELAAANRAVASAQGRADIEVQKMAISDALETLGDLDLDDLDTQAKIDAASAAIMALQAALDDATDLTNADKLAANVELTLATRAVTSAQESLTAGVGSQRMALMTAGNALAALDLADLDTAEKIAAADAAVKALMAALDGATHLSDAEKDTYQTQLVAADETVKMAQTGMDRDGRRTAQMESLTEASDTLDTALEALAGDEAPTQAQIDAAETALAALNTAIEGAEDLTDAEKAAAERAVAVAEGQIAGAKQARMVADAAQKAADDKAKADADAAMAVTARKLYAGISAPSGDANSLAANDRAAAYNNAGTPTGALVDTRILVSNSDDAALTAAIVLSEDKKTAVPAHHGWAGKRYADPAGGDSYEAIVYSNVEASKMGRKFGSAATVSATGAYEYELDAADRDGNANKALTIVPNTHAAQVSLSGVTRTAGTETFHLPDGNPEGEQYISVPGSLHSVSGTFSCNPTTDAEGCTALVAPRGFTLGAGTWIFIPSNAEARITDAVDANYASYGWWLHKNEAESKFTASAFHDFKGTAGAVEISNLVGGTATYVGGAAGKYALSSSTGGTNDAGHFTARATLEADFGADTITGTIDNFMGADDQPRDWSVALQEAALSDAGVITRAADGQNDNDTVWTIGGTAGNASGEWSGNLREEGTDGVPKGCNRHVLYRVRPRER